MGGPEAWQSELLSHLKYGINEKWQLPHLQRENVGTGVRVHCRRCKVARLAMFYIVQCEDEKNIFSLILAHSPSYLHSSQMKRLFPQGQVLFLFLHKHFFFLLRKSSFPSTPPSCCLLVLQQSAYCCSVFAVSLRLLCLRRGKGPCSVLPKLPASSASQPDDAPWYLSA